MWDRDQRLASFRIADLYAEADRIRFERLAADKSSAPGRGSRYSIRHFIERLTRSTGRDRGIELPASLFEGHAHNR